MAVINIAYQPVPVVQGIFSKNLGVEVSLMKLDKEIVRAWFETSTVEGLLINDWLKKLETNAVDRIVSASRQAMIEGLSVPSAARLIRKKGIEGSMPGLNGLARTMLHSAANHARMGTYEANSDIIEGVELSSILDGRTCLVCGADDGKFFKLDALNKPVLPRHWSCRCLYLPVTKSFKKLGLDIEGMKDQARPTVKHSEKWVNHRDGTRSRKFSPDEVGSHKGTYQSWLKSQLKTDPEFVKKVLGPTRFELFKSGELTLKNIVIKK